MNGNQKFPLGHSLFIALSITATVLSCVLYWIVATDASFPAGGSAAEQHGTASPEDAIAAIAEPDDAYELATLTFGGTCTPASMLGIDAYGTFGQAYAEGGAESFFSRIYDFFDDDDLTLVGCNSVFTDRENLPTAEKDVLEWYRAPTERAAVFSRCGIDALSLACVRTMDYGADGYADTVAALDANALLWGDSSHVITKTLTGGITAAIYCDTYTSENTAAVTAWIETARTEYDFIALYLTDTADSYTVPEDKRAAYRSFVDAGADLVVGTNGMKLQPAEAWGDGYIVYSLGSLLDGSSKYPEKYAAVLSAAIQTDGGAVKDAVYTLIPCQTYDENHSWMPQVLGDGEVRTQLEAFLAGAADFPAVE